MPKTINAFDASEEFTECWLWVKALDAYDYGDHSLLADLVASADVPDILKPAVSKIVSGERKPNLKAAAKLKVAASDRLEAAANVSLQLAVFGAYLSGPHIELPGASDVSLEKWQEGQADFCTRKIDHFADDTGSEVAEARSHLEAQSRRVIEAAAEQHSVSVRTIEEWLRDFRRKIRDFPNV